MSAGLSTCTVLYLLTAVPGYYAYGRDTESPIYNSLPIGAGRTVAIIVMTIHVILAIPIFTTSFSLEFEQFARVNEDRLGRIGAWFGRAIIRTATMVFLVILAVFVSMMGIWMDQGIKLTL